LLDFAEPGCPGRGVPVIISNLRGHCATVTNEFGDFRKRFDSSDLELKLWLKRGSGNHILRDHWRNVQIR